MTRQRYDGGRCTYDCTTPHPPFSKDVPMMKWHFTRRRMWPALATALALSACSEGQTGVTAPETEAVFAKPSAGTWNGSVTSTLADGFSYASDGLGSYQNGVGSVESIIQDAGAWVL